MSLLAFALLATLLALDPSVHLAAANELAQGDEGAAAAPTGDGDTTAVDDGPSIDDADPDSGSAEAREEDDQPDAGSTSSDDPEASAGPLSDDDGRSGESPVRAQDEGVIVPFNENNPVELNSKTATPSSSSADPLRPGSELVYALNYSCSALDQDGDCNGAVLEDELPTLQDTGGNDIQLEFVGVNATTEGHWGQHDIVEDGTPPMRRLRWEAENLVNGDSGTLFITMRIPQGVIPFRELPQDFTNTATASYNGEDVSVTSPESYVNALPPESTITKSGPANALLNLTGTDPVTYTITICPQAGTVLWDSYTVTDTLPVGATVANDPLAGDFVAADPEDGHGGTITWALEPGSHWPGPNAQGCLQWTLQVTFANAIDGGHETNEIGATKINAVEAVGSDGETSQQIGPDDTTLTLTGPVTRFGPSKQARTADGSRPTYYVQDGETVVYRLSAGNTSDVEADPFSTATLTDGPLPAEFTLQEIRTGSWTDSTADVTAEIQISNESNPDPDEPTDWHTVAVTANTAVTDDLDDVRWVRWIFSSSDEPAIGPSWSVSGMELVGSLADDADPAPRELENCTSLTGLQGGINQNRGTSCARILLETPQPHPTIGKTSTSTTLEPGQIITYTLTVGNDIDATGSLESLQLTDCVPDVDHLTVSNILPDPSGAWVLASTGDCEPVAGEPGELPNNGDTGTELVFDYIGPPLAPNETAPPITYDVTANSFTVPGPPSEPAPPGIRRNVAVVTQEDGVAFEHCVQDDCRAVRDVTIPFRAELQSRKLVRGTRDSDFSVAGTTTPGGQVTWRLEVENRSNIDVENVQYVDVFPHVGDHGVRLIDTPRGSQYAPRLVGPLDAPGWTVEYSRSSNPCRDEVLRPGDVPHHPDCEPPEWTTSPNLLDLPSYRSIRLTFAGRLARGDMAMFEWDMITPANDPAYDDGEQHGGILDCTIPVSDPPYPDSPGASELPPDRQSDDPTCPVAYNSFAYGVDVPTDQLAGLPTPGRLGAEPAQVALYVASETIPAAIGDRVWFDHDNDGIQDLDEPGVPGVRVDLLDATDPTALVQIGTTFTDDDGLYLFDDLPDGDYVLRFYLPDDIAYVSPRWRADPTITGDHGSAGNSNRDSDVPQEPSGTTALGNHYDTPIVTLGDDGDGEGEIDLTWDAGIWVPQPEITIDKVTKDTDWPDARADDGIELVEGRPVTWIYTVTNAGNTYLTDVAITDAVTTPAAGTDPPDDIDCDWADSSDPDTPAQVLAPGEVVECRAAGVAIVGDYANEATVTATPAQFPREDGEDVYEDIDKVGVPAEVSDGDPSSYHGLSVEVALDKRTAGRYYDLTTGQLADAGPDDGIVVTAGLGVTWHYTITNTGTAPLGNVVLTDDSGTPGDIDDDVIVTVATGSLIVEGIAADQVAIDGDVRGDGILRPGESWTVELQGVAVLGHYHNDAGVVAEAVDEDTGDPLTPPGDPTGRTYDDDPSEYEGVAGPAISLEKATNGVDADQPSGPYVLAGDDVTWTLEVTNTGSIPLLDVVVTDPQLGGTVCVLTLLVPGASDVCEVSGARFGPGQQRNDAAVAGTPAETSQPPGDPDDPDDWSSDPDDYVAFPDAVPVTDEDPSHHYGADPSIDLEKATDGVDADTPEEAVPVGPGQPVVWTFAVTNTGNTTLGNVLVTDAVIDASGEPVAAPVTVDCPGVTLFPGETMICTHDGVVGDGPHANLGTVTAQPLDSSDDPVGDEVEDMDPSHYRIGVADLSLTKVALDEAVPGGTMRWRLVVANAGPDDAPPGTVVTDRLPTGLGYLDASDGWACTPSASDDAPEVVCELDEAIPAGSDVALVLTTQISTDAKGEITNTATVRGVFADPDGGNDASTAEVEAIGEERLIPGPSLPRTGASVLLLVFAGLAALVSGTALRKRRH